MIKIKYVFVLFSLLLTFYSNGQYLDWAKATGSLDTDFGNSIVVDSDGNVYTVGGFGGEVDFDPGDDELLLTAFGITDMFIQKLDSEGNLIWIKQIGEDLVVHGNSIQISETGNIYITGGFAGSIDFDPSIDGEFELSNFSPALNIFVLKLSSDGEFINAISIGEFGDEEALAIAVDADENVHVTGYFYTTADFDPGPDVFLLGALSEDIFVLKLNSDLDFEWAVSMGAFPGEAAFASGYAIAVDSEGNVLTTGEFGNTVDFDPGMGGFELTASGRDVFIQKLNSSGEFVWALNYGGYNIDKGRGIAIDQADNIYTTGIFYSSADFDPGADVFTMTPSGGYNAMFIQKLDSDGNFIWAKQVSGDNDVYGLAIAINSKAIYTTGSFYATSDFDPNDGEDFIDHSDDGDIFIQKLDLDGNYIWARGIGGLEEDQGRSIYVDNDNDNVYVTGSFQHTVDFDPNEGELNYDSFGDNDYYVLKLMECEVDDELTISGITITATFDGATYQWVNCNNGHATIDGETDQSFTPEENGSYACIINNGSCVDTSECVDINSVGIVDINDISNDYLIYPNPNNGNFKIKTDKLNTPFSIFDASGKIVYQNTLISPINNYDISFLPAGFYQIEFRTDFERSKYIKLVLIK